MARSHLDLDVLRERSSDLLRYLQEHFQRAVESGEFDSALRAQQLEREDVQRGDSATAEADDAAVYDDGHRPSAPTPILDTAPEIDLGM